MKVASESEELASSTALATFCSNTSAFEEAFREPELVLEYEYRKDELRKDSLRVVGSGLWGDIANIDRRSLNERYDAGLPSEEVAVERGP